MEQLSSEDQLKVRHQFDRLCTMALKGEKNDYLRHVKYLKEHELLCEHLPEAELKKCVTVDHYPFESYRFHSFGYDIEIRDELLAEALEALTERKRNVILLSYFLEMSDAEIARRMNLVRSTISEHRNRSLELLRKYFEGGPDSNDKFK